MERQTRKRAVRLKPEALAKLQVAIDNVWRTSPESVKLTREEKARILGLSLVTSEKVLKGQGVDRPTLEHAFRRVGLSWEEGFCESVQPSVDKSANEERPKARNERPLRRRIAWAAVVSLMAIATISVFSKSASREVTMNWRGDFNRKISASELAFHRANYGAARALAEDAIDLARQHENASCLAEALRMKGDLASASGDFSAARRAYEEALNIRRSLQHFKTLPPLYEALGNVELELGDFARAEEYFQTSLAEYRAGKDQTGIAMAMRGLGTLAHRQDRLDLALQWLESGLVVLRGKGEDDLHFDIQARLALVWRDQGHLERATAALRKALQHWQQVAHRPWIAKTQMQLATVLRRSGQSEEATQYFKKSQLEFQRFGDHVLAAECQRWLDQPAQELTKRPKASPE